MPVNKTAFYVESIDSKIIKRDFEQLVIMSADGKPFFTGPKNEIVTMKFELKLKGSGNTSISTDEEICDNIKQLIISSLNDYESIS